MNDETKQLVIDLYEAGKFDQAQALINATSPALGQRTQTLEPRTERGQILKKGRSLGLDREDLFPAGEPSNFENFTADMGAGFVEQGLGVNQLAQHLIPGKDTQDIDQRVYDAAQEYQESGLADKVTGGKLASNVATVAAGGFLGRTALATRPLIGSTALGASEAAIQPVTDENYWTEKGKDMAIGAVVGAATQAPAGLIKTMEGAVNAPQQLINKMNTPSSNQGGSMFRGSPAVTAENQAVSDITGVRFSPAEISGSPAGKQMEELARAGLFTSNKVAGIDAAKAADLEKYVQGYVQSLGDGAPLHVVAPKLQAWGKERTQELIQRRSQQGRLDYDSVTRFADGQDVIPANSYANELRNIVEEGSVFGARSDAKAAAKEAASRLKELKAQGGLISGKSVASIAQSTDGKAFKKVQDFGYNDRLAGRLRNAVMEDADQVPGIQGQMRIAKDNWAKNSEMIDEFESTLTGQIIGKDFMSAVDESVRSGTPSTKVMDKFLRADSEEVTAAFRHLDSSAPELANEFRGAIIDRAKKGAYQNAAAGGTGDSFDPGMFLRNLGLSRSAEGGLRGTERIAAMFPDNPEAVNAMIRAARILGDKTAKNHSGTATSINAREALEAASALVTGSIKKILGTAGGATGLRQVARSMDGVTLPPVQLSKLRGINRVTNPVVTPLVIGANGANQ